VFQNDPKSGKSTPNVLNKDESAKKKILYTVTKDELEEDLKNSLKLLDGDGICILAL
jgi:hypothetical protein